MKEVNIYNNDFRKQQSIKILAMYGSLPDIQKSEDPGDEQPEDNTRFLKAKSESMPDMIEKGMISSQLANGYGVNEPLKFTKTGKELKEKLPTVIASLNAEKASLEAQMVIIRQKLGIDPSVAYNSYTVKGLVFYRYPWEMCDRAYDSMTQKYADATEENILCNQYNSLCSVCMDVCEDIACAEVIMANVEDNKKYTLSVNQLVALSI